MSDGKTSAPTHSWGVFVVDFCGSWGYTKYGEHRGGLHDQAEEVGQ